MYDIMIHKQKGFIVGCGGHGHDRAANFETPAARKPIFGIFVGDLGKTLRIPGKYKVCFGWFVAHQFCKKQQNLIQSI
jgi:hypothetical protein